MLTDTSSAAAGMTAAVGSAAVMWAALKVEPMVARSVAAAVIISGAAITYDIVDLPLANPSRLSPAGFFQSVVRPRRTPGCASLPLNRPNSQESFRFRQGCLQKKRP